MALLDQAADYIPNIGNKISLAVTLVTWLILLVVFTLVAIVVGFIIINKLKYKYNIVIFEKIGNRYEITTRDKAKRIVFGEAGDSVFYCRKRKKYLPLPSIQTGRRTYWFAIRDDDEWINIGIEDVNEKSKTMGIKFVDRDMKYARVAMQRNVKERFGDRKTFLQQYGGLIAYTGLIAVIGIMVWLLFDKFIDISANINAAIETANKVLDRTEKILAAQDNIASGGSGFVTQYILPFVRSMNIQFH